MNRPIDARLREVFRELPFLIGFSVDSELRVCDIEVDTWPDCAPGDVGGLLADALGDLIEEGEAEALRERTFARALH